MGFATRTELLLFSWRVVVVVVLDDDDDDSGRIYSLT